MPNQLIPKATLRQPQQPLKAEEGQANMQFETEKFLEQIAQYNQFGKILKRDSLKEVGQKLAEIADMAEVAVTNEAADWFDAHTLKRNMKEVKAYAVEFMKLAEEADMINQRMSAFYDDMGRILERYFEIPEHSDASTTPTQPDPMGDKDPANQQAVAQDHGSVEQKPEEELTEQIPVTNHPDPKVFHATPLPPTTDDPHKIDELTLRAIKAVHERLKVKNPDAARRFAKLPPIKMKELVWKIATSNEI